MGDLGIRIQEADLRFEVRRQPQFARLARRTPCSVVERPTYSVNPPVQRHRAPAFLLLVRRAVQVLEQLQCLPVAEPGPVHVLVQAVTEQAMQRLVIGLSDGKGFKNDLRKRLHQLPLNRAP